MDNGIRVTKEPAARGFSVLEIVVAVAMVAILGAIVLPAISTYIEEERVATDASTLKDLGTAIRSFKATVGNYPGRLSDLATAISSTDMTSCNRPNPTIVTYGAVNAARWSGRAPYYFKAISRTGLPLGIGIARDALTRSSTNTTSGSLQIVIPGARLLDAREMNRMIDGETDLDDPDNSNDQGAVQWDIPTQDRVILTYNIPIGNSC